MSSYLVGLNFSSNLKGFGGESTLSVSQSVSQAKELNKAVLLLLLPFATKLILSVWLADLIWCVLLTAVFTVPISNSLAARITTNYYTAVSIAIVHRCLTKAKERGGVAGVINSFVILWGLIEIPINFFLFFFPHVTPECGGVD